MSDWLTRLRERPKRVKDQYAFLVAFLITGTIASVWFVSLQSRPIALETQATSTPSTSALRTFFSEAREQLAALIANRPTLATSTLPEATSTEPASTSRNVILPNVSSTTFPRIGTPILIATSSATTSPNQ